MIMPAIEGSSADPVITASTPLVKPLISPERSRMTKVAPTKNHGRCLNVSHP
jgi:hypothetical protein